MKKSVIREGEISPLLSISSLLSEDQFLQIFVIWNMDLERNEGRGIHFGILSYLHFAGAAKSISCGNILKHPFNHLLQHTKIDVGLVLVSHKKWNRQILLSQSCSSQNDLSRQAHNVLNVPPDFQWQNENIFQGWRRRSISLYQRRGGGFA